MQFQLWPRTLSFDNARLKLDFLTDPNCHL